MFIRQPLIIKWLLIALVGAFAIIVPSSFARAQRQQVCAYDFQAAVLQGASVGTKITGTLQLSINTDGTLTGTLTDSKALNVTVVGQVSDYALNMTFELEKATGNQPGRYMFGSGTSWTKIIGDTSCGTTMGGTFSAPRPGDIGYWETRSGK